MPSKQTLVPIGFEVRIDNPQDPAFKIKVYAYWHLITYRDPKHTLHQLQSGRLPPEEELVYQLSYERFQLAQEVANLADQHGLSARQIKRFLTAVAGERSLVHQELLSRFEREGPFHEVLSAYSQFEIGADDVGEQEGFSLHKAMDHLGWLLTPRPGVKEWWRLKHFLGRDNLPILIEERFWVLNLRKDPKPRAEWGAFWQILLELYRTLQYLDYSGEALRQWLIRSVEAALKDDDKRFVAFDAQVQTLLSTLDASTKTHSPKEQQSRKAAAGFILSWMALVKEVRATRALSDQIELLRFETRQALKPYRDWFLRILEESARYAFPDKPTQQDFAAIALELCFVHQGVAEPTQLRKLLSWMGSVRRRRPVMGARLKTLRWLITTCYDFLMPGEQPKDLTRLFEGVTNPLERLRLLRDQTLRALEPYLDLFEEQLQASGGCEFSTFKEKSEFADVVNELLAIHQKRLCAPTTGESARLCVIEKSPTNSHFRFSVSGGYRGGTPLVPLDLQFIE